MAGVAGVATSKLLVREPSRVASTASSAALLFLPVRIHSQLLEFIHNY